MANAIGNTLSLMDRAGRRAYHKQYEKECATWPETMVATPVPEPMADKVAGTWRSRHFGAVLWREAHPQLGGRLSINRTAIDSDGAWKQGISWDDLMRIKSQCGFADAWAVEIYPPDEHIVNDANMRHLWLFKGDLPFGWHRTNGIRHALDT